MVFRTRDLFVRQRSQLVNALRGHLAEYGVVVAHPERSATRIMACQDAGTQASYAGGDCTGK